MFFFFFLALEYNLIYYFRESIAYLINKTISEKLKFNENTFADIYYEEDAFRDDNHKYEIKHNLYKNNDNKVENIIEWKNYVKNYKKIENVSYEFKEPKRNLYHALCENIYVFFTFLRLVILFMPKTFFILRCILFYTLITNKLIIITYFLSLTIIFASITFHLTDFTMEEIQQTYKEILSINASNWSQIMETKQIFIIKPTIDNARILFYWLIRFLSLDERRKLYNDYYKSLKYDYTAQIYFRMYNLGYWNKEITEYSFLTSNSVSFVLLFFISLEQPDINSIEMWLNIIMLN